MVPVTVYENAKQALALALKLRRPAAEIAEWRRIVAQFEAAA